MTFLEGMSQGDFDDPRGTVASHRPCEPSAHPAALTVPRANGGCAHASHASHEYVQTVSSKPCKFPLQAPSPQNVYCSSATPTGGEV